MENEYSFYKREVIKKLKQRLLNLPSNMVGEKITLIGKLTGLIASDMSDNEIKSYLQK
jgi:hypothetical protein